MHKTPKSILPLSPAVFHILLALVDGEKHGYGIMQEIEERTQGDVSMGPGTLYGAVKRLLAQGMIEEAGDYTAPDLNDERRKYYRLTGFGLRVVQAEVQRLDGLIWQAKRKQLHPQPLSGGAT